ncbi:MAG: ornithine carbamoyltransferase [Kiritimatiellae bacterium]|nr:ornithine carbamoyltransferase [Kiritimatiellia bacterium]
MSLTWKPTLKGRSLLTLLDFSDEEMLDVINLAVALKARRRQGTRGNLLARRQIALIFEKSSTRTRCAASVAVRDEGGQAEYLARGDIHLGAKESVADTGRVLGRMFDGILFRGFSQQTVEGLAKHSGVPVWNGLTDAFHPTQALADLMTIKERFGRLRGLTVAYVGDGRNNVANSLMLACAKAGVNFVNCTPGELTPDVELVERGRAIAGGNGATIRIEQDPHAGVRGAQVLYTDVWTSMGEEAQQEQRMKLLRPYQVNRRLVKETGLSDDQLVFLHCLPAFHDNQTALTREIGAMEVSDEVFEASFSKVFDQAENRMHTIKALFVSALADPEQ